MRKLLRRLREIEWRISLADYARKAWSWWMGASMSGLATWFHALPVWAAVLIALGLGIAAHGIWETVKFLWGRHKSAAKVQVQEGAPKTEVESKEHQEIAALKQEVQDKERELASVKQLFGRVRVDLCGLDSDPMGLSVAVQFINTIDSRLASKIRGWFIDTRKIWKLKNIEQVRWSKNPNDEARVVIFSDEENAAGVQGAFNDCFLIGQPVGLQRKREGMTEDVTIIVFPSESDCSR